MENKPGVEMPRYRSHKTVWAFKIAKIEPYRRKDDMSMEGDGSAMITPIESGYAPFWVSTEYMLKHKPEVGGYYVAYEDGYKSWSPAKAFEEVYTLINTPGAKPR